MWGNRFPTRTALGLPDLDLQRNKTAQAAAWISAMQARPLRYLQTGVDTVGFVRHGARCTAVSYDSTSLRARTPGSALRLSVARPQALLDTPTTHSHGTNATIAAVHASMKPVTIDPAISPCDYAAFAALIRDYVSWFMVRHRQEPAFAALVFGHQALDAELGELSVTYGPPAGRALLARRDEVVCGGGAYRRLTDGSCEMKRLFVREPFHGQGIGRLLACALIDAARADGYRLMRLDTAVLLTEAATMYRSMGFRPCEPYSAYPAQLLGYLRFLELPLS